MINMDLLIAKTLKASYDQDNPKEEVAISEYVDVSTCACAEASVLENSISFPISKQNSTITIPGMAPNIQIVNINTLPFSNTTMTLARNMTHHNELLQDFIAELRKAVQSTDKHFRMSLSQYS